MMKICWDNLEKIRYNKNTGTFRMNRITYYEHDKCAECGDSFLGQGHNIFCDERCNKIYFAKNNPWKGKTHSEETRKKMSVYRTGRAIHSDEDKIKRKLCMTGNKNPAWKNGVTKNNIPMYETYASQLEPIEQCRRNSDDPNILEVKCTYCGKWHVPTRRSVCSRIKGINGNDTLRFYCSSGCKLECPIYGKQKHYGGTKGYNSREVQPELRWLVLERDNWTCQICGNEGPLHCHHIDPVISNPIESADMDNCITLCVECHKGAHKLPGCGYGELRKCT